MSAKSPGRASLCFYTRIDRDSDRLRRRLQKELNCSANELAMKAIRALAAKVSEEQQSEVAA